MKFTRRETYRKDVTFMVDNLWCFYNSEESLSNIRRKHRWSFNFGRSRWSIWSKRTSKSNNIYLWLTTGSLGRDERRTSVGRIPLYFWRSSICKAGQYCQWSRSHFQRIRRLLLCRQFQHWWWRVLCCHDAKRLENLWLICYKDLK